MATIQRNIKTFGTRSFVGEVAAAPSHYAPILSNEVDADLDTVYAAWNGGADSVNVKDGSITYAKLAPDAQLWRDTGTTLTPGANFTSRSVVAAPIANAVQWGVSTIKGRLASMSDTVQVRCNAGTTDVIDDPSKPAWIVMLDSIGDKFAVYRAPAGATVSVAERLKIDASGDLTVGGAALQLANVGRLTTALPSGAPLVDLRANAFDQAGNNATRATWFLRLDTSVDRFEVWRQAPGGGANVQCANIDTNANLTIAGPVAVKQSGTAWVNPSDRRLKDEIEDYGAGLAAVLQLQPRTFVYNGKGGSAAGVRGYGFIADEMASVMPETIGTLAVKLDAADEDEADIQTLDQSNLILAIVNATKELAGRVAALEGAAA